VDLSRNFGKENAMLAGFDYATGDAVIIMDADLQDPVDLIPQMIALWEEGYEDVYGKRATRGRESWLRKKLSLTYYRLLQKATRIEVLQNVGDFRLLDRKCINALKELRETQRYTKGLYCWVGFRKKEFTFDRGDRAAGKSSFNMRGLFNLAIEGVLCFTTMPLRIATIVGLVVAVIAFLYLAVIICKTLIFGEVVQGFPTIVCTILFMGGVQLLALGIIGEYVGRIFNETKGRPPYIVSSSSISTTHN
jgi:glycosyltransferase involved in cell wall biosynthesis